MVQAEKTAEALRRIGVGVTVTSGDGISAADVVHVFNLQTPDWTLGQVRAAKALHKPVVVSPIYWRDFRLPLGALAQIGFVIPHLASAAMAGERGPRDVAPLLPMGHRAASRDILRACDRLLPNSQAEADHLVAEFPELRLRPEAFAVVPNGVDAAAFDRAMDAPPDPEFADLPPDFVLCVSRIDYRKNVLALVRATARLGASLVVVGAAVRSTALHRAYEAACRAHGPHVRFLGHLPQDRIWSLYRRCAVHALPSFFETPGLANLEAALAGARLVTTPRGCTREYFGDDAQYADPLSVRSVVRALKAARSRPPPAGLADRVRRLYAWDRVAEATRAVYEGLVA